MTFEPSRAGFRAAIGGDKIAALSYPARVGGLSSRMQLLIWPKLALTAVVILGAGSGAALAQAGSTGGNVGVTEKTLSGSNPEPSSDREAPKPRGREEESGRAPRRDGAGVGNFDGAWSYVVVGTNCPGSSSGAIMISSGRISARGVTGTVSASGAYHAVATGPRGLVSTATGRLSGNTGGGSFRGSDGCVGRWTASKQ